MGPDLAEMDIPAEIPNSLSKRIVMSQLNGIYDPLGLLTPFTIKGKILMCNLWAKQYDWDTVLCPVEAEKWIDFFQEMLQVKLLKFPRSIKPANASEKKPILIILSDASKDAFGCCCYVRWELTDGKFASNLLTAKGRVAPLKTSTIVRLELSAAVLAKRLRSFVEDAFRMVFQRAIHVIDSQVVKAMISKESYGFNTFVATRVGEIQTSTKSCEW